MGKVLAIVGAGRVGKALGRALRDAGWRIGPVVCRSEASAREAARATGGKPHARLTRQILDCDTVLIAVPASAVERVAEELASIGKEEWRGKAIFHTCKTRDYSALEALEAHGAITGALHPVQAFGTKVVPDFHGVYFGIEGSGRALKVARRIVRDVGGVPVRMNGSHAGLYDVALRFASNDIEMLTRASAKILRSLGFSGRQATDAAMHMARQALASVSRCKDLGSAAVPETRIEPTEFRAQQIALRGMPGEFANVYSALRTRNARRSSTNMGRHTWQH